MTRAAHPTGPVAASHRAGKAAAGHRWQKAGVVLSILGRAAALSLLVVVATGDLRWAWLAVAYVIADELGRF